MTASSDHPLLPITSTRLQVLPGYVIEFEPEDYIAIVMGQTIDRPAARFQHPNLVAAQPKVFCFKHYLASGRKRWTNKVGIEFYFVVPKSQILVVGKEGHSYPEVVVGGETIRLNVSGGGGGPWVDWIRCVSHACINYSVKVLRAVAQAALPIWECQARRIALTIESNEPGDLHIIAEASARQAAKDKLQPRMHLVLKDGCEPSEAILETRHARGVIGQSGNSRFRIANSQISWANTARKNGIHFAMPQPINHLPPNTTT
jgi:hypothetical protein